MSKRARNRAATAALVVLIAGIVLGAGTLSGTFATFTAETGQKTSTFSGGWVVGPTLGTATLSGNGASLAWTHATTGVTGQEIWFADVGGVTATCTGPTYSGLVTGGSLSATANSIGASGAPNDAVPAANEGDFICFQVRSTHNAWYTPATYATAIQVGLVPISITWNGNGTPRQIKTNSSFVITFNHGVAYSSGNVSVSVSGGVISIPGIGTISGGTFTGSTTCTNSSITISGGSHLTATVKLGGCGATVTVPVGTTATYAGSGANITSSVGSPTAVTIEQCSVASVCLPTLTY